ncbi:MAG TPA: DUF4112 domain-containing protein [Acidimicrobiales bacterium]|nr:DUF4112 domain-containing protein [Acidimicrobiales bacterium]
MTAPTRTTERDREQARQLARLLDTQFQVPGLGWRFGVDGILGLVPGIGDAAGLALSSVVLLQAVRLGARGATAARMVTNVALDAVVGSIPVIGSIFDFAYKANTRNLRLLEEHVTDPLGTSERSRSALRRTIVGVIVALVLVLALLFAFVAWLLTVLF